MAIAPLPDGIDAKVLKRRLYDEYRVEAPVTGWDEKRFLRVSFQGYNTRDDLEAVVTALENLLPEMTPVV
jgi:isopenicillin-N epimerase